MPFVRTLGVYAAAVWLFHAAASDARASWLDRGPLGIPVTAPTGDLQEPRFVSDGAGGAIGVWQTGASGNADLRAQHLLAEGRVDPAWPAEGLAVCSASGNQEDAFVVGDGAGGAIVAWADLRGGGADVYAQRVLAGGAVDPAWPRDGRAVCAAAGDQSGPVLVSDGRGGAIVVWQDERSDAGVDLFAQRLTSAGAVEWGANGRLLAGGEGDQGDPAVVSDGMGGAIVLWLADALFAQHLLPTGRVDASWPAAGSKLPTTDAPTVAVMAPDGVGGGIASWFVRSTSGDRLHALHVTPSGTVDRTWPAGGVTIPTRTASDAPPSIAGNGSGGALLAWKASEGGRDVVRVRRLLAGGIVDSLWPAHGRALVAGENPGDPGIMADGGGGGIVIWSSTIEGRRGVYAQGITAAGELSPARPVDLAGAPRDGPVAESAPPADTTRAHPAEEPAAAPTETVVTESSPAETSAPLAEPPATSPVADGRPALRATQTTGGDLQELVIDGRLGEAPWATADSIASLVTTEPQEGVAPAFPTVVKVLADGGTLAIGIRCADDPSRLVSFSKARDAELDEEDNVLVVIDTFGDGRSGYAFAINPGGSRLDGLVNPQGDDVNAEWDALWEAASSVDSSGWSAEFRIPIASLGYKKGLTQWGFNVERHVQRLQETSRWSGAKRDYQIWNMSRAGVLHGLPAFDPGMGLSIQPGSVSYLQRTAPNRPRDARSRISLDARQKIGANLTGVLTFNTDFGETEADVRQTNLSRFDILYPERREFFLDGADIFEFGSGLRVEDAELKPFFSRRIGFVVPADGDEADGREVQIRAGGKLQGRIGQTSVGALVVATDPLRELHAPRSGMAVVRVRQNVLKESSGGFIATFGGPMSRGGWTQGADFTFRTSEFLGNKNLLAGVWGLTTHQQDLGPDREAWGGTVAMPNDLLNLNATLLHIGEDFQPALGFVQRTGRIVQTASDCNIRPGWPGILRTTYGVSYFHALNSAGRQESEAVSLKPLDWLFTSGDKLSVSLAHQAEHPFESFAVFESPDRVVTIPAGRYEWNRCEVAVGFAAKRRISGEISHSFGEFYAGRLRSSALTVTLQPLSMLTFQLSGEKNSATLPQGEFTQVLESLRTELKPSPRLQVTNFLQYDNESRLLGSASRLRWSFHPLGDLFLTFNNNLFHSIPRSRWDFVSDKASMKVQYAWQL